MTKTRKQLANAINTISEFFNEPSEKGGNVLQYHQRNALYWMRVNAVQAFERNENYQQFLRDTATGIHRSSTDPEISPQEKNEIADKLEAAIFQGQHLEVYLETIAAEWEAQYEKTPFKMPKWYKSPEQRQAAARRTPADVKAEAEANARLEALGIDVGGINTSDRRNELEGASDR